MQRATATLLPCASQDELCRLQLKASMLRDAELRKMRRAPHPVQAAAGRPCSLRPLRLPPIATRSLHSTTAQLPPLRGPRVALWDGRLPFEAQELRLPPIRIPPPAPPPFVGVPANMTFSSAEF